ARIDNQVQATDLGERAEHGAKVGALEVEADRVTGVARRLRHRWLRRPRALRGWCGLRLWHDLLHLRTRLDPGRLDTNRRCLTEYRRVRRLQRRDRVVDRLIEPQREVVAIR